MMFYYDPRTNVYYAARQVQQGTTPPPYPSGSFIAGTGAGTPPAVAPGFAEESYIENILRLNRGKRVTVYMTFENSGKWKDMIFNGILLEAGRDHIILFDPDTGIRYLLLMVYLDYITFTEDINYGYGAQPTQIGPGAR